MIASHRRRHPMLVLLLAVPTAAVLFLALRDRSPMPVAEERPSSLVSTARPAAALVLEAEDLFADLDLGVRLLGGDGPPRIEMELRQALHQPDVLAYWSPGVALDALPEDASLLGPIGPGQAAFFRLPEKVREVPGRLILYSLAHREVLASAALPASALQHPAVPASEDLPKSEENPAEEAGP